MEGGIMTETSLYENMLSLQTVVLALQQRVGNLEGKHIPDKAYDIKLLREEVEELRIMRKEVYVAYSTLEVDGPNTRMVERLLHKALYRGKS
jgi:pyrimidine operon attenuation protein/uracil phosphoribosyltransferase